MTGEIALSWWKRVFYPRSILFRGSGRDRNLTEKKKSIRTAKSRWKWETREWRNSSTETLSPSHHSPPHVEMCRLCRRKQVGENHPAPPWFHRPENAIKIWPEKTTYGLNVTNPSHSSCLFVCKIYQIGARREASGGWGRKASSWRYWHFEQHSFTSTKVQNRPLSKGYLPKCSLTCARDILCRGQTGVNCITASSFTGAHVCNGNAPFTWHPRCFRGNSFRDNNAGTWSFTVFKTLSYTLPLP